MSDRPPWLNDLAKAAGSLKAAKASLARAKNALTSENASAKKRVAELLRLYELEVDDIHLRVAGLKAAEEPE
jgi:hypothetical protein